MWWGRNFEWCSWLGHFSSPYISCDINVLFLKIYWWQLDSKPLVTFQLKPCSPPRRLILFCWTFLPLTVGSAFSPILPFPSLLFSFLPLVFWVMGLPIPSSFLLTANRGFILSVFQLQVCWDSKENVFWGFRLAGSGQSSRDQVSNLRGLFSFCSANCLCSLSLFKRCMNCW